MMDVVLFAIICGTVLLALGTDVAALVAWARGRWR
jgi:hypothetical protein